MVIHLVFDVLAASCALAVTYLFYRWRLAEAADKVESLGFGYLVSLIGGAVAGGYGFGTANLWLSGVDDVGRSILGALVGAIAAVEAFKIVKGVRGSTGLLFVPAFCTSVTVGRIGCFLAGLEDQTYGTASTQPWAHDFGDGVLRHPVQLYESGAMAVFGVIAAFAIGRRSKLFMQNGFYLLVGWYGLQRFVWEFLKPYGTIAGPLNVFHILCAVLIVYAAVMMARTRA